MSFETNTIEVSPHNHTVSWLYLGNVGPTNLRAEITVYIHSQALTDVNYLVNIINPQYMMTNLSCSIVPRLVVSHYYLLNKSDYYIPKFIKL